MHRWLIALVFAFVFAAACGPSVRVVAPPPPVVAEPAPHRDAVAAQVKPFLDAELVSGVVIGLYDAGKTEVYGFGRGPNGAPPDGTTVFEFGPATKIYTALLFADAIQRREVALDTPLAELLPLGVTAPIKDKVPITLGQLAMHTSGLPRLPPSVAMRGAAQNPFGSYTEDMLYNDLIRTELVSTPGTQVAYSNYGGGVLAFALSHKLGASYDKLLTDRVLKPLGLKDTFVVVPEAARPRLAAGTNDDLAAAPAWSYGALVGAGGLFTTVHDQLQLIEAELDAADGGKLPLRHAMKFTQEPALDRSGDNEGLGWLVDSQGRYWHNGTTGGSHTFIGFDPKTKHGVVVLASTATSLVDRLADAGYKLLDNQQPAPAKFASAAELAPLAGAYELGGNKLLIIADGKRLYVEGAGEPRHRLAPVSDHEFWSEGLQSLAVFEKSDGKVTRVVFGVNDRAIAATRVDSPPDK